MDVSLFLSSLCNASIRILIIHQISLKGTIIFSIHQPRYSIFKLFDVVLLMCKGKCVYQGPPSDLIPYFNDRGYSCELHDNPADFALDILIETGRKSDSLETLSNAYTQSSMYTTIDNLLKTFVYNGRSKKLRYKEQGIIRCSFGVETYYLSSRTFKNTIRNPALILSQIVVAIILGLLVGLVFNNLENTIEPGVQNRMGAIFFMVVSQIFVTVTALETLLKERALFIHVICYILYI